MAKTLTVKGTEATVEKIAGNSVQRFTLPGSDVVAGDGLQVAASFFGNRFPSILSNGQNQNKVRWRSELYDNQGNLVRYESGVNIPEGPAMGLIVLSTNAGAAGTLFGDGADQGANFPGKPQRQIAWVVDEAAFSKGLVILRLSGFIDRAGLVVIKPTPPFAIATLNVDAHNGEIVYSCPFEVSEA